MIGLRGMGATDVGPLAAAFFQGEVQPAFLGPQFYNGPLGEQEQAAEGWYATTGFAQQVASLLGGSVIDVPPTAAAAHLFSSTPQGPPAAGTNWPNAYTVQLPDGTILPGTLFPPGIVLSYPDECAAENALVGIVPGGQLSATCAGGGTGLTPTQLALQNGSLSPNLQQTAANEIQGGSVPPATAAALAAASAPIPTPALPITPVSTPTPAPAQSSGSSAIVSPTVGSSTPPPAANPPGSQNAPTVSACFNPISQWLSMDSCLGPLGIIEWAILAGGLLLAFSGGRR